MTDTFLAEFELTPPRVMLLGGNDRSRLLNFLERWGYLTDLHACLDQVLDAQPNLVSMLDLRARAYIAEERFVEALSLIKHRIGLRDSLSAQSLQVKILLAQPDLQAAEELANALVKASPDSVTVWRLQGDVALAKGDLKAATAAFQRLGELRPNGTGYLQSMMALYRARNDWVTASGYAVRLLNTAETPEELPAGTLRALLDYFEASQEETRVLRIREALETRHALELDELKATLAPFLDKREAPAPTPTRSALQSHEPEEPDLAIEPVPVSNPERKAVAQAVKTTFGFDSLLPGQLETIAAVLRGENVLSVLPTGGGKSLCYQAPAMIAQTGTTLVISPLIALMKDQVDSLPPSLRQRAATINSSLDGDGLREHLDWTAAGRFRLVYAAPERLRQPTFLHALRRARVNRLVVDEAHCVSVWGHDFRPDYLKIADAWEALERPPILALTATAPPRVRRDIIQHLSPERPMATVVGDLVRPNLQLEVAHAANRDDKYAQLIAFCQATPGNGIVYADTRQQCEELAAMLRNQGVNAAYYHAGMDNRSAVQDAFMEGKTRVIVATIAFGMGIDKPDIRFIVHFMPPASLESYYQEAGRAGRDGKPARCLLMISRQDRATLTRRMRRDLPTVEFLRQVYAAANRYFANGSAGGGFQAVASIAPGDLARDLGVDDTRVRVAISILEENGLLLRGPDTPRAALIHLLRSQSVAMGSADAQVISSRDFWSFQNAARLSPDQWLQRNLIDSALGAGLSPVSIEQMLLEWSDAGYVECRFSGRNMLLAKTTPPDDVARRINLWLDRFTTIQIQRVDEIMAYAYTEHCRHGHLSGYLGGRKVERCASCDNCVVLSSADEPHLVSGTVGLPDEREQFRTILECLHASGHGWGQYTLVRILRGEPEAPDSARNKPGFGALNFRSHQALKDLIDRLLNDGFLALQHLDGGGKYVELTRSGEGALRDPSHLDVLMTRREPEPESIPGLAGPTEVDEELFQRLRAWRLEVAKERGIAPYIIFHDSHLRAIAASKPRTPEELLAVKGVGSRKLEAYGQAVLALVMGKEPG